MKITITKSASSALSQNSRSNQALVIFLQHTSCSASAATEHWQSVAACRSFSSSLIDDLWKRVIDCARRFALYACNCVWSQQRGGTHSSRIGWRLMALDRAEDSLKWAIAAANNAGNASNALYLHLSLAFEKVAKFSVNAMLAEARGDAEQVQLWETAIAMTEPQADPEQGLLSAVSPLVSEFPNLPEPLFKSTHADAIHTSRKLADFKRRAWACEVLLRLTQLRKQDQHKSHYRAKLRTASSIISILDEADRFHSYYRHNRLAPWDAVWKAIADKTTTFAEMGETHYNNITWWQSSQLLHQLQQCSTVVESFYHQVVRHRKQLESYESEKAAATGQKSCSSDESRMAILAKARVKLNDIEAQMLLSCLVLTPEVFSYDENRRFGKLVDELGKLVKSAAIAPTKPWKRDVYFMQQAQRVDRSLSPAHVKVAECWMAAAAQVQLTQERVVAELNVTDAAQLAAAQAETKLTQWRAVQYAQLASGLFSESAQCYERGQAAARTGNDRVAGVWVKAAELELQAGELTLEAAKTTTAFDVRHARILSPALAVTLEMSAAKLQSLARLLSRAQSCSSPEEQGFLATAIQLREQEVALEACMRQGQGSTAAANQVPIGFSCVLELIVVSDQLAFAYSQISTATLPSIAVLSLVMQARMHEVAALTLQCMGVWISSTAKWTSLNIKSVALQRTVLKSLSSLMKDISAGNAVCVDQVKLAQLRCHILRAYAANHLCESCLWSLAAEIHTKATSYVDYSAQRGIETLAPFRRHLVAALERHAERAPSADAPLPVLSCPALYKTDILQIAESFCLRYDAVFASASSERRCHSLRYLAAEQCQAAAALLIKAVEHQLTKKTDVADTVNVAQGLRKSAGEVQQSAEFYMQAAAAQATSGDTTLVGLWKQAAEVQSRPVRHNAPVQVRDLVEGEEDETMEMESQAGSMFAHAARAYAVGNVALSAAWRTAAEAALALVEITESPADLSGDGSGVDSDVNNHARQEKTAAARLLVQQAAAEALR